MRLWAIIPALAVIAAPAGASTYPSHVKVSGATATQAVLTYYSPFPCSIEASEGTAIGALVHDVDPLLFPGSNLDTRQGSVPADSSFRQFVIGQTVAEKSPGDNRYYSRALQAFTPHLARLTCPAGPANADSVSIPFTTGNILVSTFTWPTATADPNDRGTEAIPTFDYSDRNQRIIDPKTGALLRHMSFINQEQIGGTGDYPFAYASGTNWINPANALKSDGDFATYAAGGNDPICFRSDTVFDPGKQIGGIAFELTGKVGDSSTPPQQEMEVAMMLDGACNPATVTSPWLTIALPKAATYAGQTQTAGDDIKSPTPVMAAWLVSGQAPPTVLDLSMRVGTVNTEGKDIQWNNQGGGQVFPFNWGAGTPIEINTTGSTPPYPAFTFASLDSAFHGVLNSPAGTHANVNFRAPAFGFMLRPKVAAARTVSLKYARMYVNMYAGLMGNGGDGMSTMCNMKATPDGARSGYQCALLTSLPGDWQFYWTATSDGSGDTHYLGPLRISGTDGKASWNDICGGSTNAWDWLTDPVSPTVYCVTPDASHPGKQLLVAATYGGSPAYGYNADVGPLPNAGNADTYASWNVRVLSYDLLAAYAAFDSRYDAKVFGVGTVDGFQDGRVTILARAGTQDTMGWRIVFDPAAKAVSGMMSSFLQLPCAFCSIHTANTNTFNPWITTTLKNLIFDGGGAYNGPYTSKITSDGGAGVGSVSARLEDCAVAMAAIGQVNKLGVTGSHCSSLTVASEPITPASVIPANSTLIPAPIGQVMQFVADPFSGQALTGERVRLLAKSGSTWVIQRGYYSQAGSPPPPAAQPAGSLLEPLCGALPYQMLPPLNQDCCLVWWNHRDDPHALNLGDPYAQQGGNGSAPFPADADPARQIGLLATLRKEDTFAGLGHFATGSNQAQTIGLTLNDNGNNYFFPKDSPDAAKFPFWQSIAIRSHPWPGHLTDYSSIPIGVTAPWSGVFGSCVGNGADIHPSMNYTDDQSLIYSANPCGAYPGFPGTVTPLGGQLYRVTNFLPASAAPLDLKRNQLLVQVGHNAPLDVSGPACAIGPGANDSWKRGLVYKAGECFPGSVPGEVYVNAPGVSPGPVGSFIAGIYTPFDKASAYTLARDIVVMTAGSLTDYFVQYKFSGASDLIGARARKLTTGLNGTRNMSRTTNYRPLADGTWAWIPWQANSNGPRSFLLVKTPPFPPDDPARPVNDYIPVSIALRPRIPGVDNAIVEYGYNSELDCVNRIGESCVAAAVNDPYSYSISDAPIIGVPCSMECLVTINALPNSVVYWRERYRDASGATVAVERVKAMAVP